MGSIAIENRCSNPGTESFVSDYCNPELVPSDELEKRSNKCPNVSPPQIEGFRCCEDEKRSN